MYQSRIPLLLLAACGAWVACSGPGDRDGVTPEVHLLSIADRPLTVIGGGVDDDVYGVTALAFLDTGGIVVGDRSRRLRWYDREGRLLRIAGREGEGPGEFSYIASLHRLPAGSIVVHDPVNFRLTVFDADGQVSRIVPFYPDQRGNLRVGGRFPDGSLLTEMSDYFTRPGRLGIARDSVRLEHVSESGETLDAYGRFGGVYWHTNREGSGPFESYALPFSGRTLAAVTGDTTWILDDGGPRLKGMIGGQVVLETMLPDARRPLTEADIDTWAEGLAELTGSAGRGEAMRSRISELRTLTDRAPYDSLLADSQGRLWLRLEPSSPAEGQTWMVARGSISSPAYVTLPVGFKVFDFGVRSVLGVSTTELDTEQVQLWSISGISPDAPDR